MQQRTTLGELNTPFIKYAIWSADMSAVALLSKHAIIIANKRLGNACTVHETIRVKVRPGRGLTLDRPHRADKRASARQPGLGLSGCCDGQPAEQSESLVPLQYIP